MTGTVRSTGGRPLADAAVDVWQCTEDGYYDVQQPDLQPAGNGRGLFRTDAEGRFWFRTVVPSYYPIPTDGPVGRLLHATEPHPYRPAHVHFIASAPGHVDVTTHAFVAGSAYVGLLAGSAQVPVVPRHLDTLGCSPRSDLRRNDRRGLPSLCGRYD